MDEQQPATGSSGAAPPRAPCRPAASTTGTMPTTATQPSGPALHGSASVQLRAGQPPAAGPSGAGLGRPCPAPPPSTRPVSGPRPGRPGRPSSTAPAGAAERRVRNPGRAEPPQPPPRCRRPPPVPPPDRRAPSPGPEHRPPAPGHRNPVARPRHRPGAAARPAGARPGTRPVPRRLPPARCPHQPGRPFPGPVPGAGTAVPAAAGDLRRRRPGIAGARAGHRRAARGLGASRPAGRRARHRCRPGMSRRRRTARTSRTRRVVRSSRRPQPPDRPHGAVARRSHPDGSAPPIAAPPAAPSRRTAPTRSSAPASAATPAGPPPAVGAGRRRPQQRASGTVYGGTGGYPEMTMPVPMSPWRTPAR